MEVASWIVFDCLLLIFCRQASVSLLFVLSSSSSLSEQTTLNLMGTSVASEGCLSQFAIAIEHSLQVEGVFFSALPHHCRTQPVSHRQHHLPFTPAVVLKLKFRLRGTEAGVSPAPWSALQLIYWRSLACRFFFHDRFSQERSVKAPPTSPDTLWLSHCKKQQVAGSLLFFLSRAWRCFLLM